MSANWCRLTFEISIDVFKNVTILFLVIYPLYVLFSRQPDFFDGEMSHAVIRQQFDSASGENVSLAVYAIDRKTYRFDAAYSFRHFADGEKVKIIYEASNPSRAAVYAVWGYWIRWKEMLAVLIMFVVAYLMAAGITSHPTPESLIEEMEGSQPQPRKRRYED